MSTDELLRDTFAEHEYLTPDAETSWHALQGRIAEPHRSGHLLAVAAGAVVMLGVAGGAVALANRHEKHPLHAGGTGPTQTSTQRRSAAQIPAIPLHFGLGYQPPGVTQLSTGFEYASPGAGRAHSTPFVQFTASGAAWDVELMTGPLPAHGKTGTPTETTINGQPAVATYDPNGAYEIDFQRPSGQYAVVSVSVQDSGVTALQLEPSVREVAEGLVFSGPQSEVTPPFNLSQVPAGLVPVEVRVLPGHGGTSLTYDVPKATSKNSALSVSTEPDLTGDKHVGAGPDVLGHPTERYAYDDSKYDIHINVVEVEGAVNGKPVAVQSGLTFDQLDAIAGDLVLP